MSIHPSESKFQYVPTDKSEWPTDHFSNDLRLVAAAVTRLELWDWFRTESPPENQGYSWWDQPNITKISDNLQDDHGNFNNPHSGASFGCAMRNMQAIAKKGFLTWKTQYIKNSN